MKILLLNPPSELIIQRDQYCSATSKTRHYWPPIDLLMQSGLLAQEHETRILDAIVDNLTAEDSIARIHKFQPDVILALSTIITARQDLDFLKCCKDRFGCKIILMGDVYYTKPEIMISADVVDAICLQYPAPGLLSYLRGNEAPEDILYKKNGQIYRGKYSKGEIQIPTPDHLSFQLEKYRFPLTVESDFSMVVTSTCCPMGCSYCPVSSIPYRQRPLGDVLDELDMLKNAGIREVVFADLMFNANSKRLKDLCLKIIERKYDFLWSCLLRPDKVDLELLQLLKSAGCHTIMFGIDSAEEQVLASNNRKMDLEKAKKTFADCRDVGIRSFVFMILGLPGETMSSALKTINYVCSLSCEYLSVNLFVPRPGSQYFGDYNSLEEILEAGPDMDSSRATKSYCKLTLRQLQFLRTYAVLRFYLRASVLLGHLLRIRKFQQFKWLVISGFRTLVGNN